MVRFLTGCVGGRRLRSPLCRKLLLYAPTVKIHCRIVSAALELLITKLSQVANYCILEPGVDLGFEGKNRVLQRVE